MGFHGGVHPSMICPHCCREIELAKCGECSYEAPEEYMHICEKCGCDYCKDHIEDHECED